MIKKMIRYNNQVKIKNKYKQNIRQLDNIQQHTVKSGTLLSHYYNRSLFICEHVKRSNKNMANNLKNHYNRFFKVCKTS